MDEIIVPGITGEIKERGCSKCYNPFRTNAPGKVQFCKTCQEILDKKKALEALTPKAPPKATMGISGPLEPPKKKKKPSPSPAVKPAPIVPTEAYLDVEEDVVVNMPPKTQREVFIEVDNIDKAPPPTMELPPELKVIEDVQSGRLSPLAFKDDRSGEVQSALKPNQPTAPREEPKEEPKEEPWDGEFPVKEQVEEEEPEEEDDENSIPDGFNPDKFWKETSIALNSVVKKYKVIKGYRFARVSHPGGDFIDFIVPHIREMDQSINGMFGNLKNFDEELFVGHLAAFSRCNININKELELLEKEREYIISMDAFDKMIDGFVRQLEIFLKFIKTKSKEVIRLYGVSPPR